MGGWGNHCSKHWDWDSLGCFDGALLLGCRCCLLATCAGISQEGKGVGVLRPCAHSYRLWGKTAGATSLNHWLPPLGPCCWDLCGSMRRAEDQHNLEILATNELRKGYEFPPLQAWGRSFSIESEQVHPRATAWIPGQFWGFLERCPRKSWASPLKRIPRQPRPLLHVLSRPAR